MNNFSIEALNRKLENKQTKIITKEVNESEFKNKILITYGTYDLFHIGHKKIIDHLIDLNNDESKIVIGISSDRWNELKGKKSKNNQNIRMKSIKDNYPKATVIFEDHDLPEENWPKHYDQYGIYSIVMGGDHTETLKYLNKITTPKGKLMKIIFFERTPGISSTLLRELEE